jgi:hypothetical protein
MSDPKPILDYSSRSGERRRDLDEEQERRDAIRKYDEATFGDQRPIVMAISRVAAVTALALVVQFTFPPGAAKVLVWIGVSIFVVWEIATGRRSSRGLRKGSISDPLWPWS